jgi:hypothetical protein
MDLPTMSAALVLPVADQAGKLSLKGWLVTPAFFKWRGAKYPAITVREPARNESLLVLNWWLVHPFSGRQSST